MRRQLGYVLFLSSAVALLSSCASSNAVNLEEPKRVLGREEDVRIDAQVFSDKLQPNAIVQVTYEILNEREKSIALADLVPMTTFDDETRTLTVNIGTEVPGNELVPRLVRIASGEKKGFTVGVRMPTIRSTNSLSPQVPRFLRVRLHFLGEVAPFEKLLDIPEKAIQDRALADALFPQWVESTESVVTNTIPIQWGGVSMMEALTDTSVGSGAATGRRRRGRGRS